MRALARTLALVCLLFSVTAHADDGPLRMRTPSQCVTEGGSTVTLPPGVFLTEPTWDRLDAELRRLQDSETRLSAENKKLQGLTDRSSMSTLKWIGVSLLVGAIAGAAATAAVLN